MTILLASYAAQVLAAETVPCIRVPRDLFQSAAQLFPKGLPDGMRLAGAGRMLGVAIPQLPDGHKFLCLRGEKLVGEYWLATPKDRPFPRPPSFYLADKGRVAVLRSVESFAVYVNGTLTAVVTGDNLRGADVTAGGGYLFWAPAPGPSFTSSFFKRNDFSRFKEEDWPALLVRSELDGSNSEVVIRLDEDRLKKWDPLPAYHVLSPAFRSDRKLWLVGVFTGEITLAEGNGHVVRRFTLPAALKRPEDDPEIKKQQDEEMRKETEKWAAALHTDATKPAPKDVEVYWSKKSRFVHGVYARGKDLILGLATLDPPDGSLLVLRDGEETGTCFEFPESLRGKGPEAALQIAVTDDAVWFRNPFGYISWDALEALLAPKKEEAQPR